jgi:excisionase family DNA binding protein
MMVVMSTTSQAEMATTGEVGRALGVSINTVKSWVRAGKVRAVRLPSGHLRIPRSELERLLASDAGGSDRWAAYDTWRRAQGPEELDIDQFLEWNDSILRLARSFGELPEESLTAKAAGVGRMHRALAGVHT